MIKTRIATTAALITFALAALSGILIAIATPANADATITVDGTAMTETAGQAVNDAREIPAEIAAAIRGTVHSVAAPGSTSTGNHTAFRYSPLPNTHAGHGHKGSNDQPHAHRPHASVPVPAPIRGKRGHR
ncbi:hypothetical protein H7J93_21970 [Mycobacterium barrassiae]|uniref:hypothetical protein n=1 Tax=Mycobacterium barrassiae TaxID=319709 RepID=UPI002265CD84|nr:hypothetical protein [Mycobacterium barrassiae]MCV7302295.1 hypothetical protein [Mycobacterium barrassiae]